MQRKLARFNYAGQSLLAVRLLFLPFMAFLPAILRALIR